MRRYVQRRKQELGQVRRATSFPRSTTGLHTSRLGSQALGRFTFREPMQRKFVPKMYPSSGYGAVFAFVATNEMNNLRVINTP